MPKPSAARADCGSSDESQDRPGRQTSAMPRRASARAVSAGPCDAEAQAAAAALRRSVGDKFRSYAAASCSARREGRTSSGPTMLRLVLRGGCIRDRTEQARDDEVSSGAASLSPRHLGSTSAWAPLASDLGGAETEPNRVDPAGADVEPARHRMQETRLKLARARAYAMAVGMAAEVEPGGAGGEAPPADDPAPLLKAAAPAASEGAAGPPHAPQPPAQPAQGPRVRRRVAGALAAAAEAPARTPAPAGPTSPSSEEPEGRDARSATLAVGHEPPSAPRPASAFRRHRVFLVRKDTADDCGASFASEP